MRWKEKNRCRECTEDKATVTEMTRMERGASMTSQDIKLKHEQNMITVRTIALILCHIDSCMNIEIYH